MFPQVLKILHNWYCWTMACIRLWFLSFVPIMQVYGRSSPATSSEIWDWDQWTQQLKVLFKNKKKPHLVCFYAWCGMIFAVFSFRQRGWDRVLQPETGSRRRLHIVCISYDDASLAKSGRQIPRSPPIFDWAGGCGRDSGLRRSFIAWSSGVAEATSSCDSASLEYQRLPSGCW